MYMMRAWVLAAVGILGGSVLAGEVDSKNPKDPKACNNEEQAIDEAYNKGVASGWGKDQRAAWIRGFLASCESQMRESQQSFIRAKRARDKVAAQQLRDNIAHIMARMDWRSQELRWLTGELTLASAEKAVKDAENALGKADDAGKLAAQAKLDAARAELEAVRAFEAKEGAKGGEF